MRSASEADSVGAGFSVRGDIIRVIEISPVDLVPRHETVDVDGVVALDRDRVDLLVRDLDIGALGVFVAAPLVGSLNRLARHLVDELLAQPVAGLLVDLAEGDALGTAGRGMQRDRARDERELEIALPIRTRRHDKLRWKQLHNRTAALHSTVNRLLPC